MPSLDASGANLGSERGGSAEPWNVTEDGRKDGLQFSVRQKNAPCAAAGREGGPLVSGIIGATSQDVRDILAARKHEPCTLATCTSCAVGQGTRQKVRTFALAPELLRVKLFRKASLDS